MSKNSGKRGGSNDPGQTKRLDVEKLQEQYSCFPYNQGSRKRNF